MNNLMEPVVTIATAIVGLAIIAVLVSRNANTAGVIMAGGRAFSGAIGAATAPVTGSGGAMFPSLNTGDNPFSFNDL